MLIHIDNVNSIYKINIMHQYSYSVSVIKYDKILIINLSLWNKFGNNAIIFYYNTQKY